MISRTAFLRSGVGARVEEARGLDLSIQWIRHRRRFARPGRAPHLARSPFAGKIAEDRQRVVGRGGTSTAEMVSANACGVNEPSRHFMTTSRSSDSERSRMPLRYVAR